jgi:uncharacterized metal-binding protein
METLVNLLKLFSDPIEHYCLAAFVGLLVFCLTAIISTNLFKFMVWIGTSPRRMIFLMRGMVIFSLLLGIAFALLSHLGLDLFYAWYTRPLGPTLHIIKGITG